MTNSSQLETNGTPTDAASDAASVSLESVPFEPATPQPIEGFKGFGYIPLQKVHNTRDLGGMPAADGKHIRAHRLMRSGDLHHATREDLDALMGDHELAAVFDLRTLPEAKQAPDPILEMPGIEYIHESALPLDEVVVGSLSDLSSDRRVIHEFRENAGEYMKGLYVACVMSENGKQTYTRLFKLFLDTEEGAVLWHCTQGKDRTGLGAYFIEYVLGVSDEDRTRDYLATNLYMEGWLRDVEERLRHSHHFEKLDLDIEAYTYATLAHLQAALAAIDDAYGSLDVYLQQELGVGDAEKEQLRHLYLE